MTWGAIGSGVISLGTTYLASNAMKGSGGGGGGSGGGQTVSKAPWENAAPWLQSNIVGGQNLQNQYAANPFSATQQRAYGSQFANSDLMRRIMESVYGQAGQRQTFNRGNPSAVPQPFRLPSPQASMANMGLGPTYGTAANIFSGVPQQAQQPMPMSADQIDELLRRLRGESYPAQVESGADGGDGGGGDGE